MIHQSTIGVPSPFVKKILITKVKSSIKTIARNERNTTRRGILENKTTAKVIKSKNANDARLLQKKTEIMNIVASNIFVLPSRRWISESAG
jgi:hypothetical protein